MKTKQNDIIDASVPMPGPWEVITLEHSDLSTLYRVCFMPSSERVLYTDESKKLQNEQMRRRARRTENLIAAAPELLSELKKITEAIVVVREHTPPHMISSFDARFGPFLKTSRAAIAKAEGR